LSGAPALGEALLSGQLDGGLSSRVQLVAVIVTVILFAFVLELVRRRQLVERYALLWLLAATGLLVLAIWRGLLGELSDALGIASPPNALFLISIGIIVLFLLHFSVASSRLGEETKILAQEVARLDQKLRETRGEIPARNGGRRGDGGFAGHTGGDFGGHTEGDAKGHAEGEPGGSGADETAAAADAERPD
jgi:hypothetical protein